MKESVFGTDAGDEMERGCARNQWGHLVPARWQDDGTFAGDPGPGAIGTGEGQLLYGLVRALRPKVIVEIGGAYGFSTLHLAAGCRDNNDAADGCGCVYSVERVEGRRVKAAENLRLAGLSGYVQHFAHDQRPATPPIDLAFVDAEHTTAAVHDYLTWLHGRLADHALVVVHDDNIARHVQMAAQLCAQEAHPWRVVCLPQTSWGGLTLLQKE